MRKSYASASASAYREAEVLSAPPGRLVVITFDGVLASLTRARVGIAMSNHEVLLSSVDKARGLLCQLLTSLDRDRGGDIAKRLFALYLFVLGELLEISMRPDLGRLDRNISLIRELRDAFDQIASQPKGQLS
jgi:flagellar protein FliS